jgi:hypothetical protein
MVVSLGLRAANPLPPAKYHQVNLCLVRSASEQMLDCPTELNLHLSGLERIAQPSVYFSRKSLVCLDCGYAELVIPAPKLNRLKQGMSEPVNGNGHRGNISTSELYGFGSAAR